LALRYFLPLLLKQREIWKLILGEIAKTIATRCQILRQNTPNSISAGALPQTLVGELTALHQTRKWI